MGKVLTALTYLILIYVCCLGTPDVFDGLVYQLTGEKNWERQDVGEAKGIKSVITSVITKLNAEYE